MDPYMESDTFKTEYERFLVACDALEEEGVWNKAENGEMESYYFNDIMCVILHLSSSDGHFSKREAECVNDVFGFHFTAEELADLYHTQGDDVRRLLTQDVPSGVRKLKGINARLAEMYKTMLLRIGEIISASDSLTLAIEQDLLEAFIAALD